ncbi:hypothetical protein CPT_Mater118 [Bacillus phage Mater]|uniref:Uncharacterized protein n=1 Tax=Bacillus phage Mater TaxID=1540090 RepID=A0A0A0RMI7_9CAUD|nr:hypothetical protein CPT_Mater118 [Bacillus phage Mater]AIW03275.1 hypothetical protein CPT_Mater118 [Bacillus phage Mater]
MIPQTICAIIFAACMIVISLMWKYIQILMYGHPLMTGFQFVLSIVMSVLLMCVIFYSIGKNEEEAEKKND